VKEIKLRALINENGKDKNLAYWQYFTVEDLLTGLACTPFSDYIKLDTLSLFAGLHDKDGKEIWDGDRYSWLSGKNKEVGTVVFFDGMFACRPDNALDSQKNFPLNSMSSGLEVIGNVHENPELLEAKE
jgi:uncharacterized phage protein (TIGR01671 family)